MPPTDDGYKWSVSVPIAWIVGGIACIYVACGGGSSAHKPPDAPKLAPNVGYGVVNWWDQVDVEAYVQALADNHIGITEIEARPWERDFPPDTYAFLHSELHDKGIRLLVSVVNWNSASGRS